MNSKIPLTRLEARLRDVSLELDPDSMRRAGYRVIDWLIDRSSKMRESTLGMELSRDETETLLKEPMPEQASTFDRVFDEYAQKVAPHQHQYGDNDSPATPLFGRTTCQ